MTIRFRGGKAGCLVDMAYCRKLITDVNVGDCQHLGRSPVYWAARVILLQPFDRLVAETQRFAIIAAPERNVHPVGSDHAMRRSASRLSGWAASTDVINFSAVRKLAIAWSV